MPFVTISSYVTKYRLFYEAFMLLVKCLVTHIAERFFRDLTAPDYRHSLAVCVHFERHLPPYPRTMVLQTSESVYHLNL